MSEVLLQRSFYGAMALLALAALGGGLVTGGAEGLAFALFATLTLGGGVVCIWERSVVRSAFSLMATFMGIAGLFILLESDYLAMAQILIYVGGILVLILFGVMLTPPDLSERQLPRVGAGFLIIGAGTAWISLRVASTVNWAVQGAPNDGAADGVSNAKNIGVGFLDANGYVIPFELAAVVLTVALVASVYIARRKRTDLEASPAGELEA
ncbi:MAG: NADH-quinone oxidoreductase subunit J [Planctomycetota bacterium]